MKNTSIRYGILGLTATAMTAGCGGTKYSLTRAITSPVPTPAVSNVTPSPSGHQFGYWQEPVPYSLERLQSWQNWTAHGELRQSNRDVSMNGQTAGALAVGLGDREADVASHAFTSADPSPMIHYAAVNLVTDTHERCVDLSEVPAALRQNASRDSRGNLELPGNQRRIQDLLDNPTGAQIRPFSQVTPTTASQNILCFNVTRPIESRIGLIFKRELGFIHVYAVGATVDLMIPTGLNQEESFEQDLSFKVSARLAPTQDFAGYFQRSLQDRSARLLNAGPFGHPIGSACGLERVQYVRFHLNYHRGPQGVETYGITNAQAITLTRFQSISSQFSKIPAASIASASGSLNLALAPYVSGNSTSPDPTQAVCAPQYEARALCTRYLTGESQVTCTPDYLNLLRQNYGPMLSQRAFDPEHNRSFFDIQVLKVE